MKNRLVLILPLALLTGCSSTNLASIVKAASGDPATIMVDVKSIYGSARLIRVGSTNLSTTANTDGVQTKALQ